MAEQEPGLRKVRSYVLRTGRMTAGQRRAFEQHWGKFGVSYQQKLLDLKQLFGREAPLVFEIGFGMGQSLAAMAQLEAEKNFIGVEVHRPGVGKLLQLAAERNAHNLRVFEHDAVEVLRHCIPDNSIDRVQIYFPDPWHKKKHHKRRLIQKNFLDLLHKKLKKGGLLHIATDWQDYAEQVMVLLGEYDGLQNSAGDKDFIPRPDWRPLTKFEKRGESLGHGVWDILFEKIL
jgi:tRNA (guanine-N7-)-methyltransferase